VSQLPLPISWSRRGGRESLLIHSANAEAIALLRSWPNWPSPCALLVGPPRSGRTLIAHMIEGEIGARIVDDADTAAEERLFNLWNDARDSGQPLLLVAQEAPPVCAPASPPPRSPGSRRRTRPWLLRLWRMGLSWLVRPSRRMCRNLSPAGHRDVMRISTRSSRA
jgi:hypothetical protein